MHNLLNNVTSYINTSSTQCPFDDPAQFDDAESIDAKVSKVIGTIFLTCAAITFIGLISDWPKSNPKDTDERNSN